MLRNHCKECLWGFPPLSCNNRRFMTRWHNLGRRPRWPKEKWGCYRHYAPWHRCIMDKFVGFGLHKDQFCDNYWNLEKVAMEWAMEDAVSVLERMGVPVGHVTIYPEDCSPIPRGWERYTENGMHDAIIKVEVAGKHGK